MYAVAAWTFVQQSFYLSVPLHIASRFMNIPHGVVLLLTVLLLVLLIALLQMRPIARVLVITLLSLASAIMASGWYAMNAAQISPSTGQPYPADIFVIQPVMFLVNILCIIYLARPALGRLCRDYRAQVARRKAQRRVDEGNPRPLPEDGVT